MGRGRADHLGAGVQRCVCDDHAVRLPLVFAEIFSHIAASVDVEASAEEILYWIVLFRDRDILIWMVLLALPSVAYWGMLEFSLRRWRKRYWKEALYDAKDQVVYGDRWARSFAPLPPPLFARPSAPSFEEDSDWDDDVGQSRGRRSHYRGRSRRSSSGKGSAQLFAILALIAISLISFALGFLTAWLVMRWVDARYDAFSDLEAQARKAYEDQLTQFPPQGQAAGAPTDESHA